MTVIGLDTEHSKGRKVTGICREIICRMLPGGVAATELNIETHLFGLKTFFGSYQRGLEIGVCQTQNLVSRFSNICTVRSEMFLSKYKVFINLKKRQSIERSPKTWS